MLFNQIFGQKKTIFNCFYLHYSFMLELGSQKLKDYRSSCQGKRQSRAKVIAVAKYRRSSVPLGNTTRTIHNS